MQDIAQELQDSAALKLQAASTQAEIIQAMIDCIWESMQQGGKLLLCGNGERGRCATSRHRMYGAFAGAAGPLPARRHDRYVAPDRSRQRRRL